MKWLERIFKGASPSRIGEYDTRFEDVGRHNKDSPWDLCGDEDLDRAIALSLAEEEERLSKGHDTDEDLARALQESMQLRGRPSHDNSVPVQFVSSRRRVCEGCKKEIGFGRYLSCMDALWHPNCFRCHACNEPITELEFSMVSNCPYHKTCYKKLYHPKCDVCKDFIPANRTGLIEYRAHPFWGQKYCPTHEYDSTPRCCSCERVESKDVQYISLEDKRKLCLECLHTSIMDTGECQPLYHEIRDFFEGMQMKIKQEIPMLLVERQALNEAVESERDGQHHMPETRGLCLSEEQTVNTIFKRPRIVAGNRFIDMRIGPTKLTRHCEVTAILVLYGLPRLLTGSILAHELMHAWLRLNGCLVPLAGSNDESWCQGLDGLAARSAEYYKQGARFAKWRTVVSIPNGPSRLAVVEAAWGLARYAAISQENGLVPIVEPEILLDGEHNIDRTLAVAEEVWSEVFYQLANNNVMFEGILLKPSMVTPGAECKERVTPEVVAEYTLKMLKRRVPPAVPGIMFLSGGQSEVEATLNLNAMNQSPNPWHVSFSYARALQNTVLKTWGGNPEKVKAAQTALLIRAKANSLAQLGKYSAEGESEEAKKGMFVANYTY